jgi:hypothetical protein
MAGAAMMVQRGVAVLRWLQPLAKASRIRAIMAEAVLLPAEELAATPAAAPPPAAGSAGGSVSGSSSSSTAAGTGAPAPAGSSAAGEAAAAAAETAQQLWMVLGEFVEMLAPPSPQPCRLPAQSSCLARRLLLLLPQLAPNPCDREGALLTESVTLLLLLLYDARIKGDVTLHLMDCYETLLFLVGDAVEEQGDALSGATDRLTVQLFNSEQVGGWRMCGLGWAGGACAVRTHDSLLC